MQRVEPCDFSVSTLLFRKPINKMDAQVRTPIYINKCYMNSKYLNLQLFPKEWFEKSGSSNQGMILATSLGPSFDVALMCLLAGAHGAHGVGW